MAGVWVAKVYLAEKAYARAYYSENLEEAELKLTEALNQRADVDVYYVGLAEVYLSRAIQLSNQEGADMRSVSLLVAEAVNQAKKATELSPNSVSLWENLASMYENAAMIIPDARIWAIKAWEKAMELEPTNPVLYVRLANNYFSQEEGAEKAVENYEKAIKYKNNYAAAYLGLSKVYEAQGNFNKAVENYEKAIGTGTDNADLLFNYGRLLYNRNEDDDREKSKKLWLIIIENQPNHSNSLYSLGLYYEGTGNLNEALKYYYKVRDLNEDNEQVKEKIDSLVRSQATMEEIEEAEAEVAQD